MDTNKTKGKKINSSPGEKMNTNGRKTSRFVQVAVDENEVREMSTLYYTSCFPIGVKRGCSNLGELQGH